MQIYCGAEAKQSLLTIHFQNRESSHIRPHKKPVVVPIFTSQALHLARNVEIQSIPANVIVLGSYTIKLTMLSLFETYLYLMAAENPNAWICRDFDCD